MSGESAPRASSLPHEDHIPTRLEEIEGVAHALEGGEARPGGRAEQDAVHHRAVLAPAEEPEDRAQLGYLLPEADGQRHRQARRGTEPGLDGLRDAAESAAGEEHQSEDHQRDARQGVALVEEHREAHRRQEGAEDEDRRHQSGRGGGDQQSQRHQVEREPDQRNLPPRSSRPRAAPGTRRGTPRRAPLFRTSWVLSQPVPVLAARAEISEPGEYRASGVPPVGPGESGRATRGGNPRPTGPSSARRAGAARPRLPCRAGGFARPHRNSGLPARKPARSMAATRCSGPVSVGSYST